MGGKNEIRKNLGYGNEKLVICSIGGTSAGKELLQLCKNAYPLIKKEIKNLRLVLVTGPDVPEDYVKPEEGITVVGYLPELFKHLAGADLCIVTGGGTITLELTALHKPFLFFPLPSSSRIRANWARHRSIPRRTVASSTGWSAEPKPVDDGTRDGR